jgi:hypothetical protein
MQSNCQTCDCPKSHLDDQQPHSTRNKGSVASQVKDAAFQGIYPGWQTGEDEGAQPRPIFVQAGLPPKLSYSIDRVKQAEKSIGVKLAVNATWVFPYFDCYVQTPDDPMHQVNLGLWVHLLNAVFFDLKTFLESFKRSSGTSFFGKASQTEVWDRQVSTYASNCFLLY